jgi:hypothetical protein
MHHGYESDRSRVVAGAQWLDDDRLEVISQFVETSFRDRVLITFGSDGLRFERSVNVNSSARHRPPIVGRPGTGVAV